MYSTSSPALISSAQSRPASRRRGSRHTGWTVELALPQLSPGELADAVRVALSSGTAGVSLFEMEGLSDAHLDALERAAGSAILSGPP